MIKRKIGFGFIIFGIVWSILSKYFCGLICDVCVNPQLSPCYFDFLFVGIIFVVSGVSLIIEKKN